MSVEGQDWFEPIGRAAAPAQSRAGAYAHLLLVEIANFASLRRQLGIARADLLVLDVAERLAAYLPDASVGTAGRNLLELSLSTPSHGELAQLVDQVLARFAVPLPVDGAPHQVQLRIGSASTPATRVDALSLLECAEAALVDARGDTPPLTQAVDRQAEDDALLGAELRNAVERGELFLQYQPKLHLRKQRVASVEALIRWHHPRRGLVLPNDFIPQAERTGDIASVTLWTVRQVIADQHALKDAGHDLPVFINMAGGLLADPDFVAELMALILGSKAKLGIEITETSVIRDPESAIRHLKQLAEVGVVIAIDDYGAGLSSLAYLKQLPARELKIDKLFVTQLTSSHRDPLIVRSTIDLAHAMEMEVVAEGVETPAALALLAVMGCDMVQGFLISRPQTLDGLLAFLRDDSHVALATPARLPFGPLSAVRATG